VHHNQLGTQRQRVERLRTLACHIASLLGDDAMVVDRAALLCKADLATGMVGEFPELQGTMGRYYALHGGESAEVAAAIEQHYRPRFAADTLPDRGAPAVLALADRIDVLVGIYGVGLVPTGDKDPFGLRRQALAALRILLELDLPLRIYELLSTARAGYGSTKLSDRVAFDLVHFILDRAVGYFRDLGYTVEEVEAVLDLFRAHDLPANQMIPRLAALKEFRALPEAASLIEANKRSRNIVVKEKVADMARPVHPDDLVEPAERALYEALLEVAPIVAGHVERTEFAQALRALAHLRSHVDRFFTEVRVVVPDDKVRANRFALLNQLNDLLNKVANISRLPA
jgi:glycyl-tRNA synthetase beta chain